MSKTQTQHEHGGIDREINRRQMLKGLATLGGASAVGIGSMQHPRLSPVQRSEGYLFAGVAAITLAAVGGGLIVAGWDSDTSDVDPDQELEDQLYFAAESVAEGRSNWVAEMDGNYAVSDDQQTPYAQLAWSEIRTRVARARVQGLSESEALKEAGDALDKQTTRSVTNIIERWNTGVSALIEQIAFDLDESVGVFIIKANDGSEYRPARTDASRNDADGVEGTGDGSGNFFVQEKSVDTPVPASNLEGRESDLVEFGLFTDRAGGDPWLLKPTNKDGWTSWNDYIYNSSDLIASHTDLGDVTVLSPETYNHATSSILSAYNSISSDLSTYVSTMYSSFEEGLVEPADILTPTELYGQFATASEQSRMGAELAAVGALHPGTDKLGWRAKVSHPDLESESQWGQLYLMAQGKESLDIRSGTTIAASDYEVAYLGFEAADSGEWVPRMLDGSEPLEILDTEGLDTDVSVAEPPSASAGTNGEVIVWSTTDQGEAPDQLKYPADHSEWSVDIRGSVNSSQHPISDVSTREDDEGGTEYYIASTDLNEGETIEDITIKQDVTFSQTSTHVDDATTVDPEKVKQQVQEYQELKEALEQLNSGFGGGGLFGGGFPTLPGLNVVETIIVAILALAGLNFATSS